MLPRNKLGLKIAQVSFSLTSYWKDSGPQWCWKESEDATNASEITETTFMWKLIISFVHLSTRNMKLAVWTGQPQGSTQTFFVFTVNLTWKEVQSLKIQVSKFREALSSRTEKYNSSKCKQLLFSTLWHLNKNKNCSGSIDGCSAKNKHVFTVLSFWKGVSLIRSSPELLLHPKTKRQQIFHGLSCPTSAHFVSILIITANSEITWVIIHGPQADNISCLFYRRLQCYRSLIWQRLSSH